MNTLCMLSFDPSLGRIDKHSLSQQTLLELFTESITNRNIVFRSTEAPRDLSEWKKVDLNDADEVIHILWDSDLPDYLTGSIELKWLPLSVKYVDLSENKLSGTVDLTCLPDSLVLLNIGDNEFYGTVNLTSLPRNMKELLLYVNTFTGVTDFSKLPKSLIRFDVSDTLLEGEMCDFDGALMIENSLVKDMREHMSVANIAQLFGKV